MKNVKKDKGNNIINQNVINNSNSCININSNNVNSNIINNNNNNNNVNLNNKAILTVIQKNSNK